MLANLCRELSTVRQGIRTIYCFFKTRMPQIGLLATQSREVLQKLGISGPRAGLGRAGERFNPSAVIIFL